MGVTFAARVDANHGEIREGLRSAGFSVWDTHALGKGAPDLVVGGWGFVVVLMEVKDGSKPPSARKLTPDEAKFHAAWRGFPVRTVGSLQQALETMRAARAAIIEKSVFLNAG